MADFEMCCFCGDATGRAGRGEDSIYWLDGQIGPLCEDCSHELQQEVIDNDCTLSAAADLLAACKKGTSDSANACLLQAASKCRALGLINLADTLEEKYRLERIAIAKSEGK